MSTNFIVTNTTIGDSLDRINDLCMYGIAAESVKKVTTVSIERYGKNNPAYGQVVCVRQEDVKVFMKDLSTHKPRWYAYMVTEGQIEHIAGLFN